MFQIVGFKLTVKNDRFKMELRTYRIPPSALFSSSPSWDIEQLFRQNQDKMGRNRAEKSAKGRAESRTDQANIIGGSGELS